MPEVTLERVLEEVRQLTNEQQQQLRQTLNSWLSVPKQQDWTAAQEALLLHSLLAKGLISELPKREASDDYVRHGPIVVQGEPVSETIIRERR